MTNTLVASERRQSRRLTYQGSVEIEAPSRREWISGEGRDLSEGGLSVRLSERFDLHTLVRFRLSTAGVRTPVECLGRVAWTTARLDLRTEPPYPYDMGIEFVKVPAFIRRRLTRAYLHLRQQQQPPVPAPHLRGVQIGGRRYEPSVTYETSPQSSWHLIIRCEDVACYAKRFDSVSAAVAGWKVFRAERIRPAPRVRPAAPRRRRKRA